jgi:glycosyltransferase involved in cell wall biosynthesis
MPADRSRRLLFHSYHFPPIGGSGSQRPLRMARYLREHGWEPVVVTGGGATEDRWAPEDLTLAAEVPADLDVLRVPAAAEPGEPGRWRGRAERWLRLQGAWARWWVDGSVALAAPAAQGTDLIYVWMQPYVSAEAGARLAALSGRRWVADLGDPWALDEMMAYPSALHRRLDERRMRRLLGTAAAIVMSTPEAVARLLARFPELGDRPVVAIPNGFDGTDFAGAPPARDDGRFRLVHTGYLHTELGRQYRETRRLRRLLRGSVPGLDILTRSHVFLVEAIDRLLREEPALAGVLELHLAGVLTAADREVAARCPVAQLHGFVTHARSVELMRGADMLFLPMQNLPPGTRATIVPGKTYEYLASGTPVLGAVPDGDARDILTAAGNARLARPDDVAGIAEALRAEIEHRRRGEPKAAPDRDVVGRFEYRRLAAELAGVLDEAAGYLSPLVQRT